MKVRALRSALDDLARGSHFYEKQVLASVTPFLILYLRKSIRFLFSAESM
jgi:hypothetical protein